MTIGRTKPHSTLKIEGDMADVPQEIAEALKTSGLDHYLKQQGQALHAAKNLTRPIQVQ